jgi:hypothetical protein
MARIQILELPAEHHGENMITPFAVVIDQVPDDGLIDPGADYSNVAKELGARVVMIFNDTIDIPANQATAAGDVDAEGSPCSEAHGCDGECCARAERSRYPHRDGDAIVLGPEVFASSDGEVISWKGENYVRQPQAGTEARQQDAHLEERLAEARSWARHGYEIGQRHCGWTDHGTAPAWLTEGWPPHIDSCEHLRQAAALDEALSKVRALPERPEVMDAQHPDKPGYLHGYRVAIRDAKRAARPPEPTTKP